jgi:hypothetical protein
VATENLLKDLERSLDSFSYFDGFVQGLRISGNTNEQSAKLIQLYGEFQLVRAGIKEISQRCPLKNLPLEDLISVTYRAMELCEEGPAIMARIKLVMETILEGGGICQE